MRVLLVKPKARLRTIRGLEAFTRLEPLELGYLAATVPREDDVRILDLRLFRFPDAAYGRALRRYRPDVIGITGYSHEASRVRHLAARAKRDLPGATVVVGGHHATAAPADYDVPSIDAIVRGEGCGPFRSILSAVRRKEPLAGIPGVLVPGVDVSTGCDAWPEFPDPASMPLPRRDLWNPKAYRSVWTTEKMPDWAPLFPQVSMVRASWGCRMKCSFCVVPQMYRGVHRPRPAHSVAEEIASAPGRHVYFCDDENFIDESFAAELADRLEERKVDKRYFAWTRSTTVIRSPELLRRWRSIGLDTAFLGFEFIRDAELRKSRKGSTVAANEQALDILRSNGIAVHAAFMIRPEWGEDDFDELEAYVRGLPPLECSFTVCTPSPGTPDYDTMRADIWVDDPHELHDCMHPLTPTTLPLRRFAERYADLVRRGTERTPMRVAKAKVRPGDLARVVAAEARYRRAYRTIHRDYPEELRAAGAG